MAARFGPLVGGAAAVDNGTGTSGYAFFMSVFTAARLACASSVRTLLAVILLALMATMVAVPLTTACDLETRPHEWTAHADVPALKGMECLATNGTWQDLNATGKALNGPYDSDSAFGCLHAQPGLARTAQVFCILFGVLSGVACAIVLLRDIASWTSSRGMFQQVTSSLLTFGLMLALCCTSAGFYHISRNLHAPSTDLSQSPSASHIYGGSQALLFTGIVDSIVGGIALLAYLAVLANTLMTRRQFRLTIAGKVPPVMGELVTWVANRIGNGPITQSANAHTGVVHGQLVLVFHRLELLAMASFLVNLSIALFAAHHVQSMMSPHNTWPVSTNVTAQGWTAPGMYLDDTPLPTAWCRWWYDGRVTAHVAFHQAKVYGRAVIAIAVVLAVALITECALLGVTLLDKTVNMFAGKDHHVTSLLQSPTVVLLTLVQNALLVVAPSMLALVMIPAYQMNQDSGDPFTMGHWPTAAAVIAWLAVFFSVGMAFVHGVAPVRLRDSPHSNMDAGMAKTKGV